MNDLRFLAVGLLLVVAVVFLDARHPLILRVVAIGLGVSYVSAMLSGVCLKRRWPR